MPRFAKRDNVAAKCLPHLSHPFPKSSVDQIGFLAGIDYREFKVGELLENVFLRLMRGSSKMKSLRRRRKHRRKVIGHGDRAEGGGGGKLL